MPPPTIAEARKPEPGGELRQEGRPPPWGWATSSPPGTPYVHCTPTWDIGEHYIEDCACRPELDGAGFMVHNAFDGRERHEVHGAPRH